MRLKGEEEKEISLGLMGGTFDPIHIGHLVTAEEARQQFNLDSVIFIPSGHPPHKEGLAISKPEHRYLMTVLAVITNPHFTVSRHEIDAEGPSYTIDTVSYFHKVYKEKAHIYFITGADAILDIVTWRDYKELLPLCSFIAASRPGYSLQKLQKATGVAYTDISPRVHSIEIPAMAISSTFIRGRVSEGQTIKYLTPEPVEQYIRKNKLYMAQ